MILRFATIWTEKCQIEMDGESGIKLIDTETAHG